MPRPRHAPYRSREEFDMLPGGPGPHRNRLLRERWQRATRGQVQSHLPYPPRAITISSRLRQNMRHMTDQQHFEYLLSKYSRYINGLGPRPTNEEYQILHDNDAFRPASPNYSPLSPRSPEGPRPLNLDEHGFPINNIPPLNEVLPELFEHGQGLRGGAVNSEWNPYTSKGYLDKKFVLESKNPRSTEIYRERRRKEKLAQYRAHQNEFYNNSNLDQIYTDLVYGLATPHDLEALYKAENPQASKGEQVWDVIKDASRAAIGTFGKIYSPETAEVTDEIAGDNSFESVLEKHIEKNQPGNLSELVYSFDPWNYLRDIQEENDAKDEERQEAENNYRKNYAEATSRRSHLNRNELDAYKGLLSDTEFNKLSKYTDTNLTDLSTEQVNNLANELTSLYTQEKKQVDPFDLQVAALKILSKKRANGTATPEEEQAYKNKQYINITNPSMPTIDKFNNAIGSNRPEIGSDGTLVDAEFGSGLLVPGSESKVNNHSRRGIVADRPSMRLHANLANAVQVTSHGPLNPAAENAVPEVRRRRRKVLDEGAGLGPMTSIAKRAVRQGVGLKKGKGVSLFNYNPSIAGGKVRKQKVRRARKPTPYTKSGGQTYVSLKSTLITPNAHV